MMTAPHLPRNDRQPPPRQIYLIELSQPSFIATLWTIQSKATLEPFKPSLLFLENSTLTALIRHENCLK